ncbi:hypothetical protein [Shewanella fidelis]|nr:hypothetical protein [Shewanella fidelis]
MSSNEVIPELIFISKILVSIFAVLGLSYVAENVSPKVAGLLSGFPLGSAIALFYIGLEMDIEFAAQSATFTLAGFSASLVLAYCYYHASRWLEKGDKYTRWQICSMSALMSISGFLIVAYVLNLSRLSLTASFMITLASICLFAFLFRHIDDTRVDTKVALTFRVSLLRALAAASIVLLITGIAKTVGTGWAGVLSSFPITLFPFLIIIHLSYGAASVHSVIKHYPYGLGALMIYTLSVSFVYPVLGLWLGTLLSFLFATVYLLLLLMLQLAGDCFRKLG